jgi:site-specific DNA-cytosine methylase
LAEQRELLLESQLNQVMENVHGLKYLSVTKLDQLLNHYAKRGYRMDFKCYKEAGYCISSGVIEAIHCTVN